MLTTAACVWQPLCLFIVTATILYTIHETNCHIPIHIPNHCHRHRCQYAKSHRRSNLGRQQLHRQLQSLQLQLASISSASFNRFSFDQLSFSFDQFNFGQDSAPRGPDPCIERSARKKKQTSRRARPTTAPHLSARPRTSRRLLHTNAAHANLSSSHLHHLRGVCVCVCVEDRVSSARGAREKKQTSPRPTRQRHHASTPRSDATPANVHAQVHSRLHASFTFIRVAFT